MINKKLIYVIIVSLLLIPAVISLEDKPIKNKENVSIMKNVISEDLIKDFVNKYSKRLLNEKNNKLNIEEIKFRDDYIVRLTGNVNGLIYTIIE